MGRISLLTQPILFHLLAFIDFSRARVIYLLFLMNNEEPRSICGSEDDHQTRHADGPSNPFRMERITSNSSLLDNAQVTISGVPFARSFVLPPPGASNLAALPSGAIVAIPMTVDAYVGKLSFVS